jgi:membrane associated rhomboid family serine protease
MIIRSPWQTNPGTEPAIPAASERQAMDWSVALLSQGIESTPVHEPEGWQLLIPPEHYSSALTILETYQRENRRWLWRPSIRSATLLFHWGALGWGALILFMYGWSDLAGPTVAQAGFMNSIAVRTGEWWRLFTAITLHADLAHLMGNLTTGVILLGLAMARWGAGPALLAAWLAGALGNVAGLFLHSVDHTGLGASGMVMGALGLLAAASWQHRHSARGVLELVVRGLFAAILLFILIGVNPDSDLAAHLGGFIAGVLFGALFAFLPSRFLLHPAASLCSGAIAAATLVFAWGLALAHTP